MIYDLDALMFFEGRPLALSLYETLLDRIRSEIGETNLRVQKTQITFFNRHVFACVAPNRSWQKQESLTVCIFLCRPIDSPRVKVMSEPYPNRWTHRIPVCSAAEIDGELMGWLQEAYAFSNLK